MKHTKFNLFTYQISPVTTREITLFDEPLDPKELEANKNKYFYKILMQELHFYRSRHLLTYKIEYNEQDFLVFRLANKKTVTLERSFHKERVETEPSCLIAINNDPDVQLIAIEADKASFGSSFSVMEILQREFNKKLYNYSLRLYPHPKYEEQVFWDLLKKHGGQIEKLRFEFSKPNLSRVNETLSKTLKDAAKRINSAITETTFAAAPNQILENLTPGNPVIADLGHASSEGAGPVKAKFRGIRAWESTENNVTSFDCEELEVETDPETFIKIIQELKGKMNG